MTPPPPLMAVLLASRRHTVVLQYASWLIRSLTLRSGEPYSSRSLSLGETSASQKNRRSILQATLISQVRAQEGPILPDKTPIVVRIRSGPARACTLSDRPCSGMATSARQMAPSPVTRLYWRVLGVEHTRYSRKVVSKPPSSFRDPYNGTVSVVFRPIQCTTRRGYLGTHTSVIAPNAGGGKVAQSALRTSHAVHAFWWR